VLQIATGKFFHGGVREFEDYAVFYSNYSAHEELETTAATLTPTYGHGPGINTYIVKYKNRMQIGEMTPGVIHRVGDGEIVEQLRYLCTFSLGALFHPDRAYIEHLCRTSPTGTQDRIPSAFVDRVLDQRVPGKPTVSGQGSHLDSVL
jgi:hypothetical protein